MTKGLTVEVAHYRWGRGDLNGATDSTWIKAIFAASGAIRVLGHDMGPETEKMTGCFDHAYWIDVPALDAQLFTACILHKALDTNSALNFDQLKEACADWGVSFSEGDGPYSTELEVIA